MEARVNYTLVGVFVLVLGLGLFYVAFWLTEGRHVKLYRTYAVYMQDSVSGLTVQSPVKFNGVDVGYVERIEINRANTKEVLLVLDIEQNTPITTSTTATLRSQGITGILFVGLTVEDHNAPALMREQGERYPVIKAKRSILVQLDNIVKEVSDNINTLTKDIKKVLSENNRDNVKKTLENLEKFTRVLSKNTERIDASLQYATRMLHNTSVASEKLPQILEDVDKTVNSVHAMARNLNRASLEVNATMKEGRAMLQNITQQALPNTVELLGRMKGVSANLQQVTQDLKHNPSMLVRGRAAAMPGPGE